MAGNVPLFSWAKLRKDDFVNYKLTEIQVGNLMMFLNRVPLNPNCNDGHQERQAMDEICYCLANPIPEPTEESEPTAE